MKLIVCGGSKKDLGFAVRSFLDALHGKYPITLIIEGGDLGAGRHARAWAIENKVVHVTEEADYKEHGPSAWAQRNAFMLLQGEALLAFPGGMGTDDMVEQAKKAGVMVYEPFA